MLHHKTQAFLDQVRKHSAEALVAGKGSVKFRSACKEVLKELTSSLNHWADPEPTGSSLQEIVEIEYFWRQFLQHRYPEEKAYLQKASAGRLMERAVAEQAVFSAVNLGSASVRHATHVQRSCDVLHEVCKKLEVPLLPAPKAAPNVLSFDWYRGHHPKQKPASV